jgi:Helix-hairpin-helix motif
MNTFSCIIMSIAVAAMVHAQEQTFTDSSDVWKNVQIEKMFEGVLELDENSSAPEEIFQLEENPLNLNTASEEELQRIPALTNLIASRIVTRRKHERYTSVNELLEIKGITPELFSFIRKYVKIVPKRGGITMSASFLNRISTEIEERQGFINGAYPGSPLKVMNRFHLFIDKMTSPLSTLISDFDVGILTKKNPGERGLTHFLTYYSSFSVPSLSAHIIVGDYQMEDAEGLIYWGASAFGKGSDVIAPARKNGGGIHSFLSSDENSFFRGCGASIALDNMKVQILFSNKSLNATIDSLGDISALDKSGLFRTESEQRKQNSSREIMIGGRAATNLLDEIKIGGTFCRTRFDHPFKLSGNPGSTVSELWMEGVDVSFTDRTLDLFSECALDYSNSVAAIAGMTYEVIPILVVTILLRDYPPAFQSIHGNAFGESGQVQNERGVYVGIRSQPISSLCLSLYFDQFKHDQPTSLLPAPSNGNDFLALAEYRMKEQYEIAFRYERKDSPSATNGVDLYERKIQPIVHRIQQNYRFTNEFISSPSIRLSSRIEWVTVQCGDMMCPEKGLLFSQAMKWTISNSLMLQARLAVFETDSYASSIYEFEEEVPGAYSNPALFGRGMRWYFILRYQPFSKWSLAAKYAQTIKDGIKFLGTGLDEISGDSQSVVSIQIEARF